MFVPGAQGVRSIVRALPYLSSLALLLVYAHDGRRRSLPHGAVLVAAALLLLIANLLHPTSRLGSGLGQCVFQLSIAAPLFWAHKAVRSIAHLQRVLMLVFVWNLVGALLGVLQVYYPDSFMPPAFNALGLQMNDLYVEALSYVGADGQVIVRPPGLTDSPGGAAIPGGLTALTGLVLLMYRRPWWQTAGILVAVAVGLNAVYLTQVRSVLLVVVCSGLIVIAASLRGGQIGRAAGLMGLGAAAVVGAFLWAAAIGGEAIDSRFLGIRDSGAIATYQSNRGYFLSQTLGELLDQYPLGAGVGRWGMMTQYFPEHDAIDGPIHVEIQLTGWLLDGGLPMWLLYGGGVLVSLFGTWRVAVSGASTLRPAAQLTLAIQCVIAFLAMAGPAFNTQLGIQFWTFAAALQGAAASMRQGPAKP